LCGSTVYLRSRTPTYKIENKQVAPSSRPKAESNRIEPNRIESNRIESIPRTRPFTSTSRLHRIHGDPSLYRVCVRLCVCLSFFPAMAGSAPPLPIGSLRIDVLWTLVRAHDCTHRGMPSWWFLLPSPRIPAGWYRGTEQNHSSMNHCEHHRNLHRYRGLPKTGCTRSHPWQHPLLLVVVVVAVALPGPVQPLTHRLVLADHAARALASKPRRGPRTHRTTRNRPLGRTPLPLLFPET